MMLTPSNENVDKKSALFQRNAALFRKGITGQEVINGYGIWAADYDKCMDDTLYKGPRAGAELMSKYEPNKRARLLDVACGTGKVGYHLAAHGFSNIDALDPVPEMIAKARLKGCYTNFYTMLLGQHGSDTAVLDGQYDGLIAVGGMGEGHMPSSVLWEMHRIVRPGGFVIIVMREEYLLTVDEYARNFHPTLDQLQSEHKLKLIERSSFPQYFCDKQGVAFVLQVF